MDIYIPCEPCEKCGALAVYTDEEALVRCEVCKHPRRIHNGKKETELWKTNKGLLAAPKSLSHRKNRDA